MTGATRIAFLGTPAAAVPSLEALVAADDIAVEVVLTNPDRARGRRGAPVAPPVKEAAQRHGIEVWQPDRPRDVTAELAACELDACAVVAYGALLPASVLEVAGHGFVNLHFSLLPRWRGAPPVQHAIRAGDTGTGVTTFVLDPGMDTGPVLYRLEATIEPDDTAGSLTDRLAVAGAPLLVDSVRALVAGATPQPQDDSAATLAPKITPADVELDWQEPARRVVDLVRSANPAPGAHTTFRGRRLKVWRASVVDAEGAPGGVLDHGGEGTVVAAGEGSLRLDEVQPEGKARMAGTDFANGYQPEPGTVLGDG